jgi:peptide/nickel transport system ATP-binding protein
MKEGANLIEVRNLSIPLPGGADRRFAVKDLTLDLRPGEVHCIVGESGSGKSMLASAIMGLLPRGIRPSEGQICFEGSDLLQKDERGLRDLRGRRMSMIFQEPMSALNPCFRVGNQLREAFEAHGVDVPQRRLAELLRAVRIDDPGRVLRAYPHQLSGGQRQRVMIAGAMALEPQVLIADEPTTALDVTTQAEILSLIGNLQREHGTGVLFITHDFGVVAEIADRVTVMRGGSVVEEGDPEGILRHPKAAYTAELIAAIPRLSRASPRAGSSAPPIVRIDRARKTYRLSGGLFRKCTEIGALKDVSLSVQPGRTLGIVGESGSGKSTLARCIVRLESIDGGEIRIGDVSVASARGKELKQLRRDVQMVFQDPYSSLDQRRTVMAMLCEGPLNCGVPREEARNLARELVERVGLSTSALSRYPGEFSGGQRQRLCIARAISMKPKVLIADEAVSALDVSVQRQVLDLFGELRRELGIAMIFITHDVRVAAEICDEVAVMHKGEVVESGSTSIVFGNPKEDYTRRLLKAVPGSRLLPAFAG